MTEKYEHLEKLRKEVEDAKLKKEQAQHQLTRKENMIKKMEETSRKQRTHLLCTKAGYMESIFPAIKDASKTDFIQFCDGLMKIPSVKEYAKNFRPKPIEEVMQ